MEQPLPEFTPLQQRDGYLPIEDHGLIGNGTTAALIARDGSVPWLCAPQFDSPPLFGALLDRHRGGRLCVAPDGLRAARQYYEPDSAVLVTELLGERGTLRITDAFCVDQATLRGMTPEPAHELLRSVEIVEGEVDLRIEITPSGDVRVRPSAEGVRLERSDGFSATLRTEGSELLKRSTTTQRLQRGARVALRLAWGSSPATARSAVERLADTRRAWRSWLSKIEYDGPHPRSCGALRSPSNCSPTPAAVRSWRPRRARCPRRSAASAIGTTVTRGCGTPPLPSTRCAASACPPRQIGSWRGCSQRPSVTGRPTFCMTLMGSYRRQNASIRIWRAIVRRGRCAGECGSRAAPERRLR